MRIVLDSGEERDVQVGQALTGLCLLRVEVTPTEALHPQFREWFDQVVLQRFAPMSAKATESAA